MPDANYLVELRETTDVDPGLADRCVVISFIRHGECQSNVGETTDPSDPLTATGLIQAEALGRSWSETRIDKLFASTATRAIQTATILAEHNIGKPDIELSQLILERSIEWLALNHMNQGNLKLMHRELYGDPQWSNEKLRAHRPLEGGESRNDAAARSKEFLLDVVQRFGVPSETALQSIEGWSPLDSEVPPDVPHVVVASHCLFLSETYDLIHSWNDLEPPEIVDLRWKNTQWTRHLVRLNSSVDPSELDVVDIRRF
ncbi:histidine phosphatase superfamily [Mycena floridula]|nr:histidine phosphatase superfamily [Mycena floridula]